MLDDLIIPSLALALVGWLVPRGLSLVWPEGVWPLMALGFVATLVMLVFAGGFFFVLYLAQGVPLARLAEGGWRPAVVHFGRLAAVSALIWGPILVLSVAGLPKYWVKETW